MQRALCISFQLFQFSGRFYLLPSASAPCAEFPSSGSRRMASMSQCQELASPFRKKCRMALTRLALAEVSQCCAASEKTFHRCVPSSVPLACEGHREAAVPKEACFILCLVNVALRTVCRPVSVTPLPWPPGALFQVLHSVLPPDSTHLTQTCQCSLWKNQHEPGLNWGLGNWLSFAASKCLCELMHPS